MASDTLRQFAVLLSRTAPLPAIALAVGLCCTSGKQVRGPVVLDGVTMGTSYRVTVPGGCSATAEAIESVVLDELELVDSRMSTYRPESEISRLNRHRSTAPFPLSGETVEVLHLARSISETTGGAFDITVGPLVNAWGFGPRDIPGPPSREDVERLRITTGWRKLVLDGLSRSVVKLAPDLQCDLSGIAKGYAVDRIADSLSRVGCTDHLVEIGGEVRAMGSNPRGRPWRLGVERPDETGRLVQRILSLHESGVATSGDYRNFRRVDGERYSHVIDPRTGRPAASRVASATVLDPSAARADALATAMLVLGETDGLLLAEQENLPVLLIIRDGETRLREVPSSRFRARMKR